MVPTSWLAMDVSKSLASCCLGLMSVNSDRAYVGRGRTTWSSMERVLSWMNN
jgi:hypothetical protein